MLRRGRPGIPRPPRARSRIAGLCLALLAALAIVALPALPASATPSFQMPFSCGETWLAGSRAAHSPDADSIDWNQSSDADAGKPVQAGIYGTVTVQPYQNPGYGNYVDVTVGSNWVVRYAHLASVLVGNGQTVFPNTQIGTVGTSGISPTANHLHYEQRFYNGSTWTVQPAVFNGVAADVGTTPPGEGNANVSANCGDSLPSTYNGDGYDDLSLLHQVGADGVHAYNLYGKDSPFASPSLARDMSTGGWAWSKMKLASGDFNGSGEDDVAILHQVSGDKAHAHVLYGNTSTPFSYNPTLAIDLTSKGWLWSEMKLASGDFNNSGQHDVAVVRKRTDGGATVEILYGSSGTPFGYATTLAKELPGTSGYDWTKMKLAGGNFNGDNYDDLAIVQERSDGGAGVYVLFGSSGTPFGTVTLVRELPSTDGWDWDKMKIAGGNFLGSGHGDLVIAHQRADLGADLHILIGDGSPFGNGTTAVQSLTNASGWTWTKMKLAAGDYNGGGWDDLIIVHQVGTDGAHVQLFTGGTSPFGGPSLARDMSTYTWSKMKTTYAGE